MQKFIQQKLYQSLKETFYRNYTGSFLGDKFPDALSDNLCKDFSEYANSLQDYETCFMCEDYVSDNNNYKSNLANKWYNVHLGYSTRVKTQVKRASKILEVIDILKTKAQDSWLVGGCVRDSIIGHLPHDWDFCTNISYNELEELFKSHGYTVQETGKHFLVLMISKDGRSYEIANLRKDGTYVDGRRPEEVSIGTQEEDSQRRDFTVNALYYNVKTQLLEDPTCQGIEDIHDKVLRFIGKPEDRLKEDYLRAWRFMRFVHTIEFKPDKKSLKAVRANFKEIYEGSNSTRVLQELQKFINV